MVEWKHGTRILNPIYWGYYYYSVNNYYYYQNWRASSEIGIKKFRRYYGHLELAGKRLVRAMQRTQFCAKSAQNDLKPTDFLKRSFYFETEGVPLGEWASNEASNHGFL